jgi:ankyrin repeat protein
MTPSPASSPYRTPPQVNRQDNEPIFFQPVIRAQENLIFAIKNSPEDEFDRYLDQALRDGASLDRVEENGFYPLEIAVLEQRAGIARSLLARGAPLPMVAEDGFDLVMLAANNGHSAMLSVLIDLGSMMSDAKDSRGLTALHYAVMGGHLQAAMTLLDREADINRVTTHAIDSDTCERNGLNPSLARSGSTPLMLAASKKDLALADLLLSWQADPSAGARHPLEIAIINHDVTMIDLFIQKGVDPAAIMMRNGQSPLSLAVENQSSLSCIKKLLPPGTRFDDHSTTAHSPLRIAVRTGQHEIAAYLLCQGAQTESAYDGHQTIWKFASNLSDQGKMTHILVATRCADAVKFFALSHEDLIDLYHVAHHPAALAVRGFFPELLTCLVYRHQEQESALLQLTPAQQELEIAFRLMCKTEPTQAIAPLSPAKVMSAIPTPTEQQLIQSIPEKIKAQKNELYQWAKLIVDQKMNRVAHCFSREFLFSMQQACPQGVELLAQMMRELREKNGFPDNFSQLIASVWCEADEKVSQWKLDDANPESIGLCKEYYAMNRIEKLLYEKMQVQKNKNKQPPFIDTFSYQTIEKRSLPLNTFAENPVVFLDSLEHPAGQPAVHAPQLATTLCLATGLTPPQCQKIVESWKEANAAAALAFAASETENRHHFSCKAMASKLRALLPAQRSRPDGTPLPTNLRWQMQLQQWCDKTLARENNQAANDSGSGSDDTEKSRPLKRARYQ